MSVGFIEEAVKEEMVPVTISFHSGTKEIAKFGYRNAVALFANQELYEAGMVSLPRYYPSGTRLFQLQHSTIERLEVATNDLKKFIDAVKDKIANED